MAEIVGFKNAIVISRIGPADVMISPYLIYKVVLLTSYF